MTLQKSFLRRAGRPANSSSNARGLRAPRGFTLFELLVTMAVASILGAIALPKINLHQFRIDAGVRSMQGAMMQAVRYAVQRQHDMIVSFDVDGKRALTIDDQNNNGAIDPGEKVQVRPLEDGVRFAPPPAAIGSGSVAAIAGSKIKILGGYPSIVIHRDGATSTDLQIYITSSRDEPLDFKALSVTQSTGRVDYYSYRSGTWKRGGA